MRYASCVEIVAMGPRSTKANDVMTPSGYGEDGSAPSPSAPRDACTLRVVQGSGGPEAAPSPNALERRTPANLPLELSSFVGREREVADVKQLLLKDENRLVTLTGPGGCGRRALRWQ